MVWSDLPHTSIYQEQFGSPDYTLAVSFHVNPEGWFQSGTDFQERPIRAIFVHDNEEEVVYGQWDRGPMGVRYLFDSRLGRFVGTQIPSETCEPYLRYEIHSKEGHINRIGNMKAAFCK
jgi:hypothetical protein